MKQIRKEKLQVFILTLALCFVLCFLTINLIFLIQNNPKIRNYVGSSYFNYYVKKYQNDIEVSKIVETCKKYDSKIECVSLEIPFTFDFNRANNYGVRVLSPTEITKREGYSVCRDISVFRKIVLDQLNIESTFVIEPEHIYIVAFEDNKTYELNNGWFFER